ncbi:SBF-like CPA transporter family [Corynebacterium ulcerans]|uniref:SBF-like CPA transporter family n=1 Tax=Corynebacterium ulcerans FRC58 TaxID=1408268 RepID=A0ABM5U3W1_CORUL|nr:bile acid:sodium symporter family protein [Corynebacterium ulcerans]AIU31581.1 SBF-like CPA transporter family [Corynebacterium ulcerans]AIU92848.1 SBF-like CPA transporter family [Corynebacterium ulcerans]AKN78195.1 SBF-like CPA transporter family [Corynebacterium ulcerans FRC58]NOL62076.1 bile acid:sodium symporter [Corynebacterium ulcerans]NON16597.1 bile acid:sodium symporter [Corynebacterium ulcerans]
MLAKIKNLDPLIVLIVLAVIIAIFFPASGGFADVFSTATKIAIALLFFLYGARLSTKEALDGLKNWKLHLTILAFTFVVFPAIGLALKPLDMVISSGISMGILYLTLVPSTVQSSVAFTSIARGNVAGAIVSASASNLIGVFATPLLVMALMTTEGGMHIDTGVFLDIAVQLLLPFVIGQLLRRWVKDFAANKATKAVDRGSIAMVVYSAFSAGIVAGIWSSVKVWEVLFLVMFSIALVAFMLWLTKFSAQKLGFNRGDVIAIEFCGTKKSLASGLPMAAVIFGGANLGLLILPLMIFHQTQLMMCSWLAARYARNLPDNLN